MRIDFRVIVIAVMTLALTVGVLIGLFVPTPAPIVALAAVSAMVLLGAAYYFRENF